MLFIIFLYHCYGTGDVLYEMIVEGFVSNLHSHNPLKKFLSNQSNFKSIKQIHIVSFGLVVFFLYFNDPERYVFGSFILLPSF